MRKLLLLSILILPAWLLASCDQKAGTKQSTILEVVEQEITVNGKQVKTFNIVQADGTAGYRGRKGENFDIIVQNKTGQATALHWHGLILPNEEDGVPFVNQLPIASGQEAHYRFPLVQSGTYWMHSHLGTQEQLLMAAPLILYPEETASLENEKEVIMLLQDFTFEDPEAILMGLREGMDMDMDMAAHGAEDLVDIDYDAFLTNRRTLDDPDVFKFNTEEEVRLRIINASSSTNFHINLGELSGIAVAIDGEDIEPVEGRQFQLGVSERIDILLTMPAQGGSFPILAQGEGTNMQTGLILTTENESDLALSTDTEEVAPAFNNEQEKNFQAKSPLEPPQSRQALRVIDVDLGGSMENYVWMIDNELWPNIKPTFIKEGERIEINLKNNTMMSHPMHLHGHVFQVVAIDGERLSGAKQDTVLVLPGSTVTIAFDADNPGVWAFHCHLLFHSESGMMTTINYADYSPTDFYLNRIGMTRETYEQVREDRLK